VSDDDFEPIDNFEGFEGFAEMGKMGLYIYRSVIVNGGSENEAFNITAAFFAGMGKANQTDLTDDEE
jgi:hypothetical protein